MAVFHTHFDDTTIKPLLRWKPEEIDASPETSARACLVCILIGWGPFASARYRHRAQLQPVHLQHRALGFCHFRIF